MSAPDYMPTPDEIAAATAKLQQRWSDNERRARTRGRGGVAPTPSETTYREPLVYRLDKPKRRDR